MSPLELQMLTTLNQTGQRSPPGCEWKGSLNVDLIIVFVFTFSEAASAEQPTTEPVADKPPTMEPPTTPVPATTTTLWTTIKNKMPKVSLPTALTPPQSASSGPVTPLVTPPVKPSVVTPATPETTTFRTMITSKMPVVRLPSSIPTRRHVPTTRILDIDPEGNRRGGWKEKEKSTENVKGEEAETAIEDPRPEPFQSHGDRTFVTAIAVFLTITTIIVWVILWKYR